MQRDTGGAMNRADILTNRIGGAGWLGALRVYLGFVLAANLAWEIVQLPLYTIWKDGTVGEIVFAVAHCTGGDALIATVSLVGALLLFARTNWPQERYGAVASAAVIAGVGYTIFSEWLNTKVRGSWTYSELMPTLPLLDVGLSPIAQWIVIPIAGFWLARRAASQAQE